MRDYRLKALLYIERKCRKTIVVKSKDLIKGNKYCTLSMLQHLGYYKYIDYNYDGDNTTVNMCDKGYDYINNAKARFVTNSLSVVAIIVSIVAICRT